MRDVDICYSTVCFDCIDMYWKKKKKKKKKKITYLKKKKKKKNPRKTAETNTGIFQHLG